MKMIEPLHKAAQYLSAAGNSFLEKKADDSHANLGWSIKHKRLETHSFSSTNNKLALNFSSFSLEWLEGSAVKESLGLDESAHGDIVTWIKRLTADNGITKAYEWKFQYELPYDTIVDSFQFQLLDKNELPELISRFDIAQQALEALLVENPLSSEIRVWPHHFDMGIYAEVDNGPAIGAGLAIPDSMVDDLYYYMYGWKDGATVPTSSFEALNKGTWHTENWLGATLASSNVDVNTAKQFLSEAFGMLKEKQPQG